MGVNAKVIADKWRALDGRVVTIDDITFLELGVGRAWRHIGAIYCERLTVGQGPNTTSHRTAEEWIDVLAIGLGLGLSECGYCDGRGYIRQPEDGAMTCKNCCGDGKV